MGDTSIEIVIVDDHPVVSAGIEAWCRTADKPAINVISSGPNVG